MGYTQGSGDHDPRKHRCLSGLGKTGLGRRWQWVFFCGVAENGVVGRMAHGPAPL